MPNASCAHDLLVSRKAALAGLLAGMIVLTSGVATQTSAEKIDLEAVRRIRDAALNYAQPMEMVGELSDVSGPRLTGSPGLRHAEEYARDKLLEWGLANAHLEAWGTFGRGGALARFDCKMVY